MKIVEENYKRIIKNKVNLFFSMGFMILSFAGNAYVSISPGTNHITFDSPSKIVIENLSEDKAATVTLVMEELAQQKNGAFGFVPYHPARKVKRSLIPYVALIDQDGQDLLFKTFELPPKSKRTVNVVESFPAYLHDGSFHSVIRANIEGEKTINVSYLFYTHQQQKVRVLFNRFYYDMNKKKLIVSIKNRGNVYTKAKLNISYNDPKTGFQFNIEMALVDFLLPGKSLKKEFALNGRLGKYLSLFCNKFNEEYPKNNCPKTIVVIGQLEGIGEYHNTVYKLPPLTAILNRGN